MIEILLKTFYSAMNKARRFQLKKQSLLGNPKFACFKKKAFSPRIQTKYLVWCCRTADSFSEFKGSIVFIYLFIFAKYFADILEIILIEEHVSNGIIEVVILNGQRGIVTLTLSIIIFVDI